LKWKRLSFFGSSGQPWHASFGAPFIFIYFFPVSEKEEWEVVRTKQPALQQEKCARHEQAQH
jgi:hypothetical protein